MNLKISEKDILDILKEYGSLHPTEITVALARKKFGSELTVASYTYATQIDIDVRKRMWLMVDNQLINFNKESKAELK